MKVDAPLAPEDASAAAESFFRLYALRLRPYECGSDQLLARIWRESRKWTMTLIRMEKVKDLHHQQGAQIWRQFI